MPQPVQASPFKAMAAVEAVKGAASLMAKFKGSGSGSSVPTTAPRPVSAPAGKTPVVPSGGPAGPSAPPAPTPSAPSPSNSPVTPTAGAAEKQLVPAPQPTELTSTPQPNVQAKADEKPKTKAGAKVARGALKGAEVAGQVMTFIPPTSGVGKVVTVGTKAIGSADRVHQRLKESKGDSWPHGSSSRKAGPSVVNPRNQNLPGSKPKKMDAMDKELQKMIADAAHAKKSASPVSPSASKGKSMASV